MHQEGDSCADDCVDCLGTDLHNAEHYWFHSIQLPKFYSSRHLSNTSVLNPNYCSTSACLPKSYFSWPSLKVDVFMKNILVEVVSWAKFCCLEVKETVMGRDVSDKV